MREAKRDIGQSPSRSCYGVVMEGTGRLPTDYTGRLDVPRFGKLGDIVILRVSGGETFGGEGDVRTVTARELAGLRQGFAHTGYRATGGDSSLRSLMPPQLLATKQGDACGLLEDTRKAKRLFLDSGHELVSAHLSGFAYATPSAGITLLGNALARARAAGLPALFLALPRSVATRLLPLPAGFQVTEAPAAVYGLNLETGRDWWVDTAEI
jgi:hypothetical protein